MGTILFFRMLAYNHGARQRRKLGWLSTCSQGWPTPGFCYLAERILRVIVS